ncbi:hypothetical protein CU097_002801 [Rhizopus azygosporus]|uniref:Uncharacterized protein n=1 Tax=Rhizopus azygosporus TaxID=86630 RepID=A0A367IUS3_RHIAZ|nr:hypothetical protein CU097_002801 [Rhizopus azygosporus]
MGRGPTCISLPAENMTYENAIPTRIMDTDGTKLVTRIKAFNALVTSSLDLDALASPEVASSIVSFYMNDSSCVKGTSTFMAWKGTSEISQNNNTVSIVLHMI